MKLEYNDRVRVKGTKAIRFFNAYTLSGEAEIGFYDKNFCEKTMFVPLQDLEFIAPRTELKKETLFEVVDSLGIKRANESDPIISVNFLIEILKASQEKHSDKELFIQEVALKLGIADLTFIMSHEREETDEDLLMKYKAERRAIALREHRRKNKNTYVPVCKGDVWYL